MKYLIINPFGIGDVLFTTPLINAIKEASPKATISYWCNERAKDLFKNDPRIDKVFGLSRGDLKKIYGRSRFEGVRRFFRLFLRIKGERFDVSFDFSLDHRYGLLAQLAGIKKRIGFNYKKRGRFLTDRVDIAGYSGKHVVEYYLDLLKFAGLKPASKQLSVAVAQSSKDKSRILLTALGAGPKDLLIALAPGAGASWGKQASLKHWPAIRFAQLGDRLISEYSAKILLIGDESERPLAEIIRYSMKHKPIDLVGKTTLEELIAHISNARVLVTNDGGPLHLAVALQVPTVSIFGPVEERVYGPYPPSPAAHIVVTNPIACRPCYQGFRMDTCDNQRECIQSISTDQVFDAVRRLL